MAPSELEKYWGVYSLDPLEPGSIFTVPSEIQEPPGLGGGGTHEVANTHSLAYGAPLKVGNGSLTWEEGNRFCYRTMKRPWDAFFSTSWLHGHWKLSTILEWEREREMRSQGKYCPVATWDNGFPVVGVACDFALARQLSERLINNPKTAKEQMWD